MGEVEKALQVTPEIFRESYNALQPKKYQDIVFYCMAGVRSLAALQAAQDLGFTKWVKILLAVCRFSRCIESEI